MPRDHRGMAAAGLALAVVTVAALVGFSAGRPPTSLGALPYLAARSVLRMLVAFVLSTLFALVYGYTCATNRRAARVLLPVLDVLQSVPILGFFPAAVLFFVGLFHGSIWGLEAASIFLIFTSQNWNMTFGVYEALSTIPRETVDAANVMGCHGAMRVRRVLLPACVPKLVYNGIVSWAGGWYFVTASEIISANGTNTTLPGIGSALFTFSETGNLAGIAAALGVLVATVLLFEFLAWRPLQVLAERFKFEAVRSTVQPRSRALDAYRRLLPRRAAGPPTPTTPPPTRHPLRPHWNRPVRLLRIARATAWLLFIGLFVGALSLLGYHLALVLTRPLPAEASSIPAAMLASFLRLSIAYVVTVLWTVPAAIFIARNERASRILLPLTEVLASLPAAALFPIIVLVFVRFGFGLTAPSVLLALTGMQWYLLFNLIAGARQVPNDLIAAATLQGVRGPLLWRRVLLPAMAPALVTGSITAWGGGWNALIVSEYVTFGGKTYHAFGIGDLLDRATFDHPNPALLLLCVLAMVGFIYALNVAFWKPLYRKVMAKYRLEG